MQNLIFSINAVAPIFMIVFFGVLLKKKGLINDNFTSTSTNLVFKIALPALLFRDVAKTDITSVFDINLILFVIIGTILQLLVFWISSSTFIKDKAVLGAFVQGSFRSNFAIIGLPLAYNLFGQAGFTKCAVVLPFTIPLYNVLAIILLTVTSHDTVSSSNKGIITSIIKNPLILAIISAFPFSYFQVQLPDVASKTIEYLAAVAIPLALLGMGGSFSFAGVKKNIGLSLSATLLKIIVSPLVFTLLAFYLGFRNEALGAVFILFGSPAAVTSYIMARAMKSDSDLAASIVLLTTLGSILTLFAGIFIFKTIGII